MLLSIIVFGIILLAWIVSKSRKGYDDDDDYFLFI